MTFTARENVNYGNDTLKGSCSVHCRNKRLKRFNDGSFNVSHGPGQTMNSSRLKIKLQSSLIFHLKI